MPVSHYLELVDWTGRNLPGDAQGTIPEAVTPILERLALGPRQWLLKVPVIESRYWRTIGQVDALLERARQMRRRWIRGIGVARSLERAAQPS